MKVLTIFGTRPEAIKMAPIVRELNSRGIENAVCLTGQHKELLDNALEVAGIKETHNLSTMILNQSLEELTARLVTKITPVLKDESPDIVLVHGDTTTAFAAALAAFYQKITVGHVEAGLRTLNPYSPFPEEMNRSLITRLASYHFAPTPRAANNLTREGVPERQVFVTGNTIVDALLHIQRKLCLDTIGVASLESQYPILRERRRIITVTMHRRENLGKPMQRICDAILKLARQNKDTVFFVPSHPNPKVRDLVISTLYGKEDNIMVSEAVPYHVFLLLMQRSYILLSDSGGIQEEAPTFKKPVLILRETTERPEVIESGFGILVGSETNKIIRHTQALLDDSNLYSKITNGTSPFGDGFASKEIVNAVSHAIA